MWKFFKHGNVYAGPEPKKNKDKHSRMAAVYAGPEYFERVSGKRDAEMRDVYAGPMEMDEIYNNPITDSDDRPYPENLIEREEEEQAYPENLSEENENIKNMVEGVYAAPFVPGTICNQNETRMGLVYMAPTPENSQPIDLAISMAYAAPGFGPGANNGFNGMSMNNVPGFNPPSGMSAASATPKGPGKKCSKCGNIMPLTSKFCAECGEKIADILNVEVKCTSCDATIPAGSKFCPECGTIREGLVLS